MTTRPRLSPASTAAASPGPDRPVAADRPSPRRWQPVKGWRDLLVGRRPEDVLERIMADDPLRLRALAGQRIRATARFLDADRVVLRAMARIAHGVSFDGPPDDRSWIADEVDAALEDVLLAERTAVRSIARGTPEGAPASVHGGASTFDVLARQLDLTGSELRRACDAFNRRPLPERVAFFSLFVESLPLDAAASACSASITEVAQRARRALEALVEAADRDPGEAEEQV